MPAPSDADAETFVPEWARSAVWYQIFPERFRNGDPSNDPTVDDIRGADPLEPPAEWAVHPWGSDWYALQSYERANGEPELWKHLLRRRYGGDLQGVIDKLDYLVDLGVTALYLNPVFDSPSLHKYDGASYHHIDPTFGPDPAGDRALIATENPLAPATWVWTGADELALTLIREAHTRGLRVIFDGVFNHMGIRSFAFEDVQRNRQASPYADWFEIESWGDPATGAPLQYEGWWGVETLPEFRQVGGSLAPGPAAYVFAATERWMNPKGLGPDAGLDGWRLDVAFEVPHLFWKRWRAHVKALNPDAYLTAELILPPEAAAPYFEGDEFDGEMSYNFAFAASEFLFHPEPISATAFAARLDELQTLYAPEVAAVSMTLFGSHDANRIGSHIVNRGIARYRDWHTYLNVSKADNPTYEVRKPNAEERRLHRQFVVFQMTALGAPMIYYGDEVGMWGANDPDCRKPMLWPDLDYQPETTNPDQSTRPPDSVAPDLDLFRHYQRLIALRKAHPALLRGSQRVLFTDDAAGVVAFERERGTSRAVVVLTNADREGRVQIPGMEGAWRDALTGEAFESEDGYVALTLAPRDARVLVPR
jgi:glycosidase